MIADYDPFRNLNPNHEVDERIKAATGLATIDASTINLIAESMHHNHFERISGLDRHPDGIRCAEATIASHRRNFAVFGATYVGNPMSTSIFALFEFDTNVAFVLDNLNDWGMLAQNTFPLSYRTCDVRASNQCDSENATIMCAIKRGDYVCIYKSCETCRAWFDLDANKRKWSEHRDFAMGYPWDDRERVWERPADWDNGSDPWG